MVSLLDMHTLYTCAFRCYMLNICTVHQAILLHVFISGKNRFVDVVQQTATQSIQNSSFHLKTSGQFISTMHSLQTVAQ